MGRIGKRPLSNAQSSSQSQSQSHEEGKSRSYVVWTTEMDIALASVLYDQVNQGNKSHGDWKPQAYQVAVDELNATLQLQLTKDNVKNRMKSWKRHYGVIFEIRSQSTFPWTEEKKMVVVTAEDRKKWVDYVEV